MKDDLKDANLKLQKSKDELKESLQKIEELKKVIDAQKIVI